MPDNNATAEYFQDQADRAQTPWQRAHYQRCADQYRAQSSQRKLTEAMQQLMETAEALISHGQGRIAQEYLPTIRQLIVRQRQLIERKRNEGIDTAASENVLQTFQRRVSKLEHQLAALNDDLKI
jgi:hypothetical protein